MGGAGGTPVHINNTQKWVTWASKQPHRNHTVHPSNHLVVGSNNSQISPMVDPVRQVVVIANSGVSVHCAVM